MDTERVIETMMRNRIVGEDKIDPKSLFANPANFRKHPRAQREALEKVLDTVGWVQRVIVNRNTGVIIDGHLRVEIAADRKEPVPVVYVDLTEDEQQAMLAVIDPIGDMAEIDPSALGDILGTIADRDRDLMALLELVHAPLFAEPAEKPEYVQEIRSPIYEPTGPMPLVSALYSDDKTKELVREIEESDIDDEIKAFLSAAAWRHTVLNFDKIANYYAHAPAKVQRLMEASALVIIDYNQAVERGFLVLNEKIMEAFDEDYPNAR